MEIDFKQQLESIEKIIGSSASTIIGAPEYNLSKLRDLLSCLNKTELGPFNASEHKNTLLALYRLIAKTATKIFENIIPSYRIKHQSEQKAQRSKDVIRLHQYESSFLSIYKGFYLDYLKRMLDSVKNKPTSTFFIHLVKTEQSDKILLAETAVECFGRILATHPHFNFRDQLIEHLVAFNAQARYPRCAEIAHKYLSKVLCNDKLGDVSLEITAAICELAKKRKLSVSGLVFKTLLDLRLIDVKSADKEEKEKRRQEKEKLAELKKKQSRKERKRSKKMKKLKTELLETEAHVTTDQKLTHHRLILKKLFLTYFRLIKYHEDLDGEPRETKKFVKLLPYVLAGISKFAHLIDVDMCNDVFPMVNRLLENSAVTNNCKLHCLSTVFVIYKTLESELDKVDPENFYKHFYVILSNLSTHEMDENELQSLINCIHLMLIKRARLINNKRYCAFVRRLLVLALNLPNRFTTRLLEAIKILFLQRPNVNALLDSSNCSDFGSGHFNMEVDDPDYSNADSSVAWELQLLSNHNDTAIRNFVSNMQPVQ